ARDLEAEHAALAEAAPHRDLAAVEYHDVLDDGKPEPGAALLARPRLVHAVEALEDPRLIPLVDPGAGVGDLAPSSILGGPERERDTAALGVLEGVVDQVGELLLDAHAVAGRGRRGPGLDAQREPRLLRARAEAR